MVTFKQVCFVCPEAYELYAEGDTYLGYIRVRGGEATIRNADDKIVYSFTFEGDPLKGFFTDSEREQFFKKTLELVVGSADVDYVVTDVVKWEDS